MNGLTGQGRSLEGVEGGGAAEAADVDGGGVGGRSGDVGPPPAGLLLFTGEVGSERGLFLPIFKVTWRSGPDEGGGWVVGRGNNWPLPTMAGRRKQRRACLFTSGRD